MVLLPHEFTYVSVKELSCGAELVTQLAFSTSRGSQSFWCVAQDVGDPQSSVGGQLHRGDTPPLQLCQVLVHSPTIRYNVGARETPLLDNWHQCLYCPVWHNLHAETTVPFDGSKNRYAVHTSPSVEFPSEEV